MHLYLDLSLDLREDTHSRPVSQIRFHQPVETITAPCVFYDVCIVANFLPIAQSLVKLVLKHYKIFSSIVLGIVKVSQDRQIAYLNGHYSFGALKNK